jgi:ribosomal protein S18 acetylase RimI-like enzyme
MNIVVRKADMYDVEMISLIGRISFVNAFENVFDHCNLKEYVRKVYDPDMIARSFERENNVYLIAEINRRPVGFAKMKIFSLNDEIESVSQMEVEKMYVLPEYQQSGAGTALLKKAIDFAHQQNSEYLWLNVYTGNHRAVRFYERNGFVKGSRYHRGFGSQYFEFFLMMLPVHVDECVSC